MFKAKNKTYGSLLVFLAIVILTFFAATSLIGKLKADSDKVKDRKILLVRLNRQKSQISRIRNDYQNQKNEMEKIEETFLDPKKTVDFIVEIERIAQKAPVGIEIKTAEKNAEKNETPSTLNYQLITTGKFNNLMHFLAYLENIKYNIKINGLKITAAGNGRESQPFSNDEVKATVDLDVYISG